MAPTEHGLLRRAFHVWERAAATYLEALVRSPFYLGTTSGLMGSFLRSKKVSDAGVQSLLTSLGLPSRRDQERILHLLHRIEGRIDDLELRLGRMG